METETEYPYSVATGTIEDASRAIEPLAVLWCIPGLCENRWLHAFKLLEW